MADTSTPATPRRKLTELRVPLVWAVKKKIALAAIEENTTQGKLALRFILDGLDARAKAPPKG